MKEYNLLFVTGCPRSGTTFLMNLLNSHPLFAICNEINLHALHREFSNWSREKYNKTTNLSRELSAREKKLDGRHYGHIPIPSIAVPEALAAYCKSIKNNSEKTRYFGDKFPRLYLNDLSSLFDEANIRITVIHVSRNPLEVVNSIARRIHGARLGKDAWKAIKTVDEAIHEWKHAWNARSLFYQSFPSIKMIDLNYNAIIENPIPALAPLSDLLGVPNEMSYSLVSNAPIKSYLSQQEIKKILDSFKESNLVSRWKGLPLFLDQEDFLFRSR